MSHLNSLQRRAVNRMGNVMCPRHDNFPSFKELDCVAHADIVLNELPESDLNDLKLLLTVLFFMPAPLMKLMFAFLETTQNMGGPLGPLLRMIRFGLRGIVFSLYYSGLKGPKATAAMTPHQVIGYQVHVAALDQK